MGDFFLCVDYDGGPAAASENKSSNKLKLITHDQLLTFTMEPLCVFLFVFFLILQHIDLLGPHRLHMW